MTNVPSTRIEAKAGLGAGLGGGLGAGLNKEKRLDVVGLLFHKLKSKRARSIYGILSVCGFVINLMPLEPVPVWTPFDCCLILIQKEK